MWRVLLTACAVAVALGCASEVGAETRQVESTQMGRWDLVAFAGDPDEYGSCSIVTVNQAGVEFGVWTDTLGGWQMVLSAKEWQLGEGSEYDVLYAIDGQGPIKAKALAVVDNSVHIPLGHEFSSTDSLRRGNRISIQTAQQTFSFDLGGSARALDGMRDCARRWLGRRDASGKSADASTASDPDLPQRMPGSLSTSFRPAKVGLWTIDARTNFMNGAFTYCFAEPPDTGPYHLSISLDRRREWRLQILNANWQLNLNAPLDVRYGIDDGPLTRAAGRSVIVQMTTVELGKEPGLIDELPRGRRFRFQVNGEDFSFDLSGAGRALDATVKCVEHYAAEG